MSSAFIGSRPRSIYEKATSPKSPPPASLDRFHLVIQGETLISIANVEYNLLEYDPNLWRGIIDANGITDVVNFGQPGDEWVGKMIRIPQPPLPDFT